jgi:hypothetical protein
MREKAEMMLLVRPWPPQNDGWCVCCPSAARHLVVFDVMPRDVRQLIELLAGASIISLHQPFSRSMSSTASHCCKNLASPCISINRSLLQASPDSIPQKLTSKAPVVCALTGKRLKPHPSPCFSINPTQGKNRHDSYCLGALLIRESRLSAELRTGHKRETW